MNIFCGQKVTDNSAYHSNCSPFLQLTPTLSSNHFATLEKPYQSCVNYVYTYRPVSNVFFYCTSSFKFHNILLKWLKLLVC